MSLGKNKVKVLLVLDKRIHEKLRADSHKFDPPSVSAVVRTILLNYYSKRGKV